MKTRFSLSHFSNMEFGTFPISSISLRKYFYEEKIIKQAPFKVSCSYWSSDPYWDCYSLSILEDFQPCFMPFRLEQYTARKNSVSCVLLDYLWKTDKQTNKPLAERSCKFDSK